MTGLQTTVRACWLYAHMLWGMPLLAKHAVLLCASCLYRAAAKKMANACQMQGAACVQLLLNICSVCNMYARAGDGP